MFTAFTKPTVQATIEQVREQRDARYSRRLQEQALSRIVRVFRLQRSRHCMISEAVEQLMAITDAHFNIVRPSQSSSVSVTDLAQQRTVKLMADSATAPAPLQVVRCASLLCFVLKWCRFGDHTVGALAKKRAGPSDGAESTSAAQTAHQFSQERKQQRRVATAHALVCGTRLIALSINQTLKQSIAALFVGKATDQLSAAFGKLCCQLLRFVCRVGMAEGWYMAVHTALQTLKALLYGGKGWGSVRPPPESNSQTVRAMESVAMIITTHVGKWYGAMLEDDLFRVIAARSTRDVDADGAGVIETGISSVAQRGVFLLCNTKESGERCMRALVTDWWCDELVHARVYCGDSSNFFKALCDTAVATKTTSPYLFANVCSSCEGTNGLGSGGDAQRAFTTYVRECCKAKEVIKVYGAGGNSKHSGGKHTIDYRSHLAALWSLTCVDIVFKELFDAVGGSPNSSTGGGSEAVSVERKSSGSNKSLFRQLKERASTKKGRETKGVLPQRTTADGKGKQTKPDAQRLQAAAMASHFTVPPWFPVLELLRDVVVKTKAYSVLNTLSYHPLFLRGLHHFIAIHGVFYSAYLYNPMTLQPEMTRVMETVLAMFCGVYSHYLQICDDGEFYVDQFPFPMVVVEDIVQFLNQVVSVTLVRSSAQSASVAGEEHNLRLSASKVLRQLIQLNARVGFCGTGGEKDAKKIDAHHHRFWSRGSGYDQHIFESDLLGKESMLFLSHLPHAVPFITRVKVLRSLIQRDRDTYVKSNAKLKMKIRRNHVVADAYKYFMQVDSATVPLLRARLYIVFVDHFGREEEGIDAGGVYKEFLELVIKETFHPNYGLFCMTERNQLYPNPQSTSIFPSPSECLNNYRFIGRVLAKAIYEGINIDIPLAPFFVNTLVDVPNTLDDLKALDPQHHKSLMDLKQMTDVSDAYLFFCVEEEHVGKAVVVDLIPNGREVLVTNDNVVQFMHVTAHYKLYKCMKQQSTAFLSGMEDIISRHWLRMFSQNEVVQLISGSSRGFDVGDLQHNCKLQGYNPDSRTMNLLWEVLRDFSEEDQGKFLQFCTGCSKAPLGGFSAMNPAFTIRKTEDGSVKSYFVDVDRLPSASTCFNMLKLPPYKSKSNLKEKLLQAITSGAGFALS